MSSLNKQGTLENGGKSEELDQTAIATESVSTGPQTTSQYVKRGIGSATSGASELVENLQRDIRALSAESRSQFRLYLLRFFFTMALLNILSSLLLFYGTEFRYYFGTIFNVAKFYGYIDGPHPHLQRTSSVAQFLLALLNFTAWRYDQQVLTSLALTSDVVFCVSMFLETFYYAAIRIEIVVFGTFFVLANMGWALKEQISLAQIRQRERGSSTAETGRSTGKTE